MYKILLCCASSLTTNMLVSSIKNEAKNRGIDVLCWAVAQSAIDYSWAEADCVLLAPQARSEIERIENMTNHNVPCAVINGADFSKMNGKAVLDQAVNLIENKI